MVVDWDGRSGGVENTGGKNINEQSKLVGYVSEYGRFYGGRSERNTGVGTSDPSDPFWNVQHLERSEQGPGICPARNFPGQYGTGSIPGD